MKDTIEKIIKEMIIKWEWNYTEKEACIEIRKILTNNLIEEKEEDENPKYKVWEYVVVTWYEDLKYIKIFSVQLNNGYEYNEEFDEDEIRKPTNKELNKYYYK